MKTKRTAGPKGISSELPKLRKDENINKKSWHRWQKIYFKEKRRLKVEKEKLDTKRSCEITKVLSF